MKLSAQEYLINALAAAVNSAACLPPPAELQQEILTLAHSHKLLPLFWLSQKAFEKDYPEAVRAFAREQCDKAKVRHATQAHELAALLGLFSQNGIDCLPLKGFGLKALYPQGYARVMGDLDIFVPRENFAAADALMPSLGYSPAGEDAHHKSYFKKPIMNVELHRSLVDPDDPTYRFFEEAPLAPAGQPHLLALGREVNYCYVVAHAARHFESGGCGIKAVLDLFLFEKKLSPDRGRVGQILKEIGLSGFEREIAALGRLWFENGYRQSALGDFILSGAAFGSERTRLASSIARGGGDYGKARRANFARALFPALAQMKTIYPSLEKAPALLPLFWIARLLAKLLRSPAQAAAKARETAAGDRENFDLIRSVYDRD